MSAARRPEPQLRVYQHDTGLGAHHADTGLTAENTDLDLPAGTKVTILGADEERGGLVLIQWTDPHGTGRITSIEPGFFAEHFAEV